MNIEEMTVEELGREERQCRDEVLRCMQSSNFAGATRWRSDAKEYADELGRRVRESRLKDGEVVG